MISGDDYFTLETNLNEKYAFYQGEIFAMSGGAFNHATMSANVVTELTMNLRGKCCQATNSDIILR